LQKPACVNPQDARRSPQASQVNRKGGIAQKAKDILLARQLARQ